MRFAECLSGFLIVQETDNISSKKFLRTVVNRSLTRDRIQINNDFFLLVQHFQS